MKRFTVILILAAMLSALILPVCTFADALGDLDGDENVTSDDAVYLLRHTLFSDAYPLNAFADFDHDGSVTSDDAVYLLRHTLFTAQYPLTGDTSDDESSEESEEIIMGPVCVSLNRSYTADPDPSEKYPDSYNMQLTDGIISARNDISYSDSHYAGYWVNGEVKTVVLTLDLGAVTDEVYRFEADCMSNRSAGVGVPSSASVEYSSDGKQWHAAGNMTVPDYSDDAAATLYLELTDRVSCRYVRYTLNKSSAWIFVDEIGVYAIGEVRDKVLMKQELAQLYSSEPFTETSLQKTLDSIKTGVPDKTQFHCDILAEKSYTADAETAAAFPDTDNMLTDTLTGEDMDGGTWVGFNGGSDINIVVPIGEEITNIAGFSLHSLSSGKGNIEHPRCVIFSVSQDGKSWKQAARCYAPAGDQQVFEFAVELSCTVKAKYVRFTLCAEDCTLLLIDEIAAYVYDDRRTNDSAYPPLRFPEITENIYWDSSEPQYGLISNLLKGRSVQIYCEAGANADDITNNTPVTSPILTDGVYASDLDFHGGKFFKFHGSGKRYLFFDLEHVSSIYSFKASMIRVLSWSIYAPSSVPVLVSEDAVTWFTAGEIKLDPDADYKRISSKLTLSKPVNARFICFCVDVTSWAGIDELEIGATKAIASNSADPEEWEGGLPIFGSPEWQEDTDIEWGEFDNTLGAKDIYLAYHGQSRHPGVDDLLPIFGHLGTDGNYDDTMYDGALFLMSGKFPSNLEGGTGGILSYTKADAEWLLSELFKPTENIPALETAVGQIKNTLGLPNSYKVKYYVSLYYPRCDDFGDIDGDGKSEDLSTAAGKIKVLKWWIDKFEAERAKYSFKNIEFAGYYWYNESMRSGDEAITNAVAEKVHSCGSVFFWIPYYAAQGWSNWRDYGFDTVCLQPNYAFHTDVPITRIPSAVRVAKAGKMSLEIEMDHRVAIDIRYKLRYYEYLKQGFKLGYQEHCPHLYYVGASLQSYARSSDPALRQIYDYTYGFIKGTLVLSPEKPDDMSVKCASNKPVSSKIKAKSSGELLYAIVSYPSHGTLTLESDGSFTYYPNKGFKGTDTFEIACSELLDYSDPCTVTVKVN